MPLVSVVQDESASATPVQAGKAPQKALLSTRRQNCCSRGSRSSTRLPAMMPALMAPIEVPMIQSGSTPASCKAW
jgi:hypothetical protein